jgi:predicted DNA-binding transcriptional regulator YafY
MDYLTYQNKIDYIKYLISKKRTGSPRALANKLDVSERIAKRMVKFIRSQDYSITFCRDANSYIFND